MLRVFAVVLFAGCVGNPESPNEEDPSSGDATDLMVKLDDSGLFNLLDMRANGTADGAEIVGERALHLFVGDSFGAATASLRTWDTHVEGMPAGGCIRDMRLEVESASTGDPAIATVDVTEAGLAITPQAAGTTRVEFTGFVVSTTPVDGIEIVMSEEDIAACEAWWTDPVVSMNYRFDVTVTDPGNVDMVPVTPPNSTDADVLLVEGSGTYVQFTVRDPSGLALIDAPNWRDVAWFSLRGLDGASGGTLSATQFGARVGSEAPGVFELESHLGDLLTVDVRPTSELSDFELGLFYETRGYQQVPNEGTFRFLWGNALQVSLVSLALPEGEIPVAPIDVTLQSNTPGVCSVRQASPQELEAFWLDAHVELAVEFARSGTCSLTAEAAGMMREYSVTLGE